MRVALDGRQFYERTSGMSLYGVSLTRALAAVRPDLELILLYAGGTETIAIAIYRLNDLGQLEVVSALAVFMIAVVLALTGLINWLSESRSASEKTRMQV